MSVLFTLAVISLAGAWAVIVLRRLSRLRQQVKLTWQRFASDQANEAVKKVYNKHVALYNEALDAFPANLFGPAAGFKPAKHF